MATRIIPHKKAVAVDLTKPIGTEAMLRDASGEDCYTNQWMHDSPLCNMCASLEVCGILYNAKMAKTVKALEKENGVTYLDNMHFNEIDEDAIIVWLKKKPRTGKQFIDAIEKLAECSDRDTTVAWCKSFIVERKNISLGADKIIKVK